MGQRLLEIGGGTAHSSSRLAAKLGRSDGATTISAEIPRPPYLVVSYYTPDTAYEIHARALARSLDRLGLDHAIEPRPSMGSWVENCAQKALFIRDMHQRSDRPILWIDADARVMRPLRELAHVDADFSVLRRDGWSFYAGQIYFGTGPQAQALIDRWCAYCSRHPHVWDQVSLGYAWWDMTLAGELRSHWLPDTISAKMKRNPLIRALQLRTTSAAILHRQESRSSKRRQNDAPRREFATGDLPGWWREAARNEAPFALDPGLAGELGLD